MGDGRSAACNVTADVPFYWKGGVHVLFPADLHVGRAEHALEKVGLGEKEKAGSLLTTSRANHSKAERY